MRLWQNPASPFARKVRIVVRETGLESRIEEIATMVSPVAPNAELAVQNPLVKIPALLTDDGTVLYDSDVICEYLDSLHAGAKLFPADKTRWTALRLQSLCDGVLEAAVLCRYEMAVRPEQFRWTGWVDGQFIKIRNALDAMEHEQPSWNGVFTIGQITAACVLGYLDFRFPDEAWRKSRPRLASWFEQISKRPSIVGSVPSA